MNFHILPRRGWTAVYVFLYLLLEVSSSAVEDSGLRRLSANLTSIYFIGDLHGDVGCAKKWIQQTHLVDFSSFPWKWSGTDSDAIVFMGDYVDKGSQSRAVLEFVRSLEQLFPDHITAIMGNHDLYMLIDNAMDPKYHTFPMGQHVHDFTYSFFHPEEYIESGWSPSRSDDEELMLALHRGLQYTYKNSLHGSMYICTPDNSKCSPHDDDVFQTAPVFARSPELAERVKDRVNLWRSEYGQGLVQSGLIEWLSKRPIVVVVGDSLISHGGVPVQILNYLISHANSETTQPIFVGDLLHYALNEPLSDFWNQHSSELKSPFSLNQSIPELAFQIAMEVVNYRGYFHSQRGCQEVSHVLKAMEPMGVKRIVVGHTPHSMSHEKCSGQLIAADSSLSRSFRAYGNMYCPIDGKFQTIIRSGTEIGDDCSELINDRCQGSIRRISRKSEDELWGRHSEEIFMSTPIDESRSDITGDEL